MSSVQLLDKTRKIGKLLHNNNSSKVVFNDICSVMKDILYSNVLVISKKGKLLGIGESDGTETIMELLGNSVGEFIDPMLNERFLGVLSTKENVNLETLGFEKIDAGIRPSLRRSRSQANALERFLSTSVTRNMTSTTSFCANTAPPLWVLRCFAQ